MTNKALDKYIALQSQIEDQLELLKQKIQEAQDNTLPEDINWSHVGDLGHIQKALENLINPI
jgi:hypothetical protein